MATLLDETERKRPPILSYPIPPTSTIPKYSCDGALLRLKEIVEALPPEYGIVAYLDGVDGFVVGKEEEIISTFLDFRL
jgi:hypothetical protein